MANKKKKAGDGQLLGPVTHIKANASDTKALNNKAPSILTRQTQPSKNTVALSPMNHLRNETKTSTQMYSGKGNTKTRDVTKVRGQTTTQSTSSKGSKSSKSSKTKTKAGDGQKLGSVYHISGAKTDRDKRMMNAALSGKNTSAPSYMLSDKGKRKKEEADAAQTNNPMGRLQRHAYRTQTSTQDNYLQSEADAKLDSKTLSGLRKKSKEAGGTTKLSRFDKRWVSDDHQKDLQNMKELWESGQKMIDSGNVKQGKQMQKTAHDTAESIRDYYGYSGGASGSDFRTGEWADTERIDGSTMTAEGRQVLRAAKSAYNRAKKAGDTKAMQEAAKAGQDARNNAANYDPERVKAYRDSLGEKQPRQNTDAYGRSIYTPTRTQQEHDELWGTAFKEGILGGFQTLLDTAAKATHNAIQNRYDPAYQSRQFTARELQRKAEGRLSEREKQILEAQAARANKDKFEAYQNADGLIEKIKLGGVYEKAINDYVREHTPDDREKIRLAAEAAKMRAEAKEVKHDEGLNTENSVGMRRLQRANEATQALVDAAKTPVGKFATKAGLSMLQMAPFLAANVIPGAGQAISLGGMSALAAGQKAGELQADPKVSAQEALGRGLVSGGIEAFTEKISLDRLLNLIRKGGGTSFIKAVAKQAGVEASEESASYALNYLADKAAQDPKAKFSLKDLGESAAIGAVSGAAFGAGGHFMGDALANGTRSTRTTPTLDETTPSPTPDTETLPTQETAPRPTQEADTAPSDNPLIRATRAQEDMQAQAQEQAQANQETRNQLLSARERLERAQADYQQRVQSWQERADRATTQEEIDDLMTEKEELEYESNLLHGEQVRTEREEAGQLSKNYEDASSHIDQRTAQDVSKPSVKAFQWDHPEMHQYYAKAAQALLQDIEYSKAGQFSEKGRGTVVTKSEAMKQAERMGISRADLEKALNAIINDEGQENYATAKKVEIVLDEMLSKGYIPNEAGYSANRVDSQVPPNEAYIMAKERIPGAVKRGSFEAYREQNRLALELGETTEEQLYQEWQTEQQVQNQPEIVGEKPTQPQQRSYDEIPNTFDEYKAQFQDDIDSREMTEGQLLDEYNALKRRNARIQNKQAAQPVQNDATPYNNPGLRDSVGAAREEFDPYSRALNRYGAIEPGENPSRMVDVPRSMTGSDRVRKFARTAMEAGITSDNTVELLQKAVADGEFSYAPKSQKNMVDRAMKALSTPRNAAKAMAQWEQVVNGERVVTDEDVTLGIMMMKAAEQAGDSQTAKQLAAEVAAFGTELGRGVNALRLLKKATPEGKLFYIRKSVDKLNQNIRKRNKGKNKNGDASQTLLNASQRGSQETAVQTLKNDISSAVDQAAKDVSKEVSGERPVRNQTKKAAKDKKQTKQNRENVDLKDWAKETGNDLAKRIASKLNKPQTQRPITRTILSDLMQFAEEHALPKKQQGPKRQAVDRLRDYFANKQFYAEAWVQAQRALREKYAGNQEALDALESFTDSTMDYNADPLHRQNVIINAMMDDIKQTGGLKDYLAREALGAGKQNVNQLANRLIMDTGVSGSDAQVLRSGVEHSFGDMMEDQNGMKLENLIRDALKDNQTTLTEVAKMSPKQKESVGRLISESLQSKYGIEQAYADKVSDTILSEYTEEVATRAREILESKFKPRGQRVTREIQDIIKEYANLGAFSDQAFNELTTSKLFGTEDITVPDDLAQQLVNAKTQEEQDAAIDAIYDYVADRVPKDTVMRMDAWRYFAMLGNPRTHMRNVDGNVLMQGVTRSSNLTSAALQRVLIKDASERTRTGVGTREAHRFAKEDFEKNKDLLSGNSYTSESGEIMRRVREKAFTVDANKKEQSAFWRAVDAAMKPMHKLSDFNTKALDWEDMLFKRVTYIDSMANFLTARGYGKNLDSVPEKVLQEARTHAIDDALEATFQQYSELASKLAQMEASSKAGQFLIGGTFPFKRVPINIAKTAVKFSPAGLVKTMTSDAMKLRNGEITAADFCDNLGAGLNGSGLAVLGAFLFANGILSVGESDDDKQAGFDAAMGSQNYAINIGDYSYTIDWAAPSVVPMFIGAEFWNAIKSKDEEAGFTKAAMDAVGRMFEPLMQMTMLSGVSSSLKSAAYSQNDPIYAILANVGTNYAGQFVPTLLGQVARTIDPTRRTTFTDANSKVPKPIQQFLQRQGAKIPGLSQKMPEYLDVWGRNDEGSDNVLLRALENFISPGYASKKTGGTMEQELQRLNDAGYEGMLPGAVQKSAKLDGNRMTADQWMKRQKEQGSVSYDILNDFIGTKEYNALTDDQKAKFVEKAYEYAKNSGQAAAGADTSDMAKWYEAANNAPSEGDLSKAEFLSLYAYKSAIEDEAPDEAKASVKQGMWEEYIKSRTDLSEKQRNYVLDNVKFWQMTPADSGAYQKAKNAGYETPEEIQKLLEVKSTFSTDGNTDINNSEMYKGITGYTSDPAEQEKMYDAIKDADATKSWKELAAEQSKQQSVESAAQTALDKALSKDMQAKFAAAMEGAGTKQTDAYRALTGTGASEAECKAYYAYLSAQNGWKKTWEQVKKKAAKGE